LLEHSLYRSRAALTALLLFVALTLSACAAQSANAPEQDPGAAPSTAESETAESETAEAPPVETGAEPAETEPAEARETPPDTELSEEEEELRRVQEEAARRATPDLDGELEGPPESRDWYEEGDAEPQKLVSSDSSSGAIPAVKPFNFGRDPGGPEDKTLYLSVPSIGLADVPVYDSLSEESLRDSVSHVPATGFPWQDGANTYIAGHRVGYPGTGSDRIFYDLDKISPGDEITLRDAAGGEYVYQVTEQFVVGPNNVEVMNAPDDGRSIVSLQTCTLPDYSERIVVQGDLVRSSPA
jgi:sortase A